MNERVHACGPVAETGAEFGGRKIFSRPKRLLNDVFFGKNFHFQGKNLLFRIFPFFFQIFLIFTMLNVVYDRFLTKKHLSLLCSYFHAHPTTLLLKILGRTNAWAVPHLKFLGGPSPLGLRPWQLTLFRLHGLRTTEPTLTILE